MTVRKVLQLYKVERYLALKSQQTNQNQNHNKQQQQQTEFEICKQREIWPKIVFFLFFFLKK